jgi:hypothetical protein
MITRATEDKAIVLGQYTGFVQDRFEDAFFASPAADVIGHPPPQRLLCHAHWFGRPRAQRPNVPSAVSAN